MGTYITPIKIQGKKSKLVPFILSNLPKTIDGAWIEPFMGSGVVGFNARPKKAVFSDLNPHIIDFYNSIKDGRIDAKIAREWLAENGAILSERGQEWYNHVRNRFNNEHNPLDFLFLNRSCFNGLIRFNKKMEYNVPYGHKPKRFSKAYLTKICNQIDKSTVIISENDYTFKCQDFRLAILEAEENDFIYCDPPYIGRHVDYYDSWGENEETALETMLKSSKAKFMVSSWHSNQYRNNTYLDSTWLEYRKVTTEHFYHVGANTNNRSTVIEAIIMNYDG